MENEKHLIISISILFLQNPIKKKKHFYYHRHKLKV